MSFSWVRQVLDICYIWFSICWKFVWGKNPSFLWRLQKGTARGPSTRWSHVQTGRPSRCESWWHLTDFVMIQCEEILDFYFSGILLVQKNRDSKFCQFQRGLQVRLRCPFARPHLEPQSRQDPDWKVRFGKCGQQMSLTLEVYCGHRRCYIYVNAYALMH